MTAVDNGHTNYEPEEVDSDDDPDCEGLERIGRLGRVTRNDTIPVDRP